MVFYYMGLYCCIRGVQEHHDLKIEQIKHHPADVGVNHCYVFYEYTKLISKNNQHHHKDMSLLDQNKLVKISR